MAAKGLSRRSAISRENLIPHSGFNSPQLAANFKRIFKFDTPSACGGAVYFSFLRDLCVFALKKSIHYLTGGIMNKTISLIARLGLALLLLAGLWSPQPAEAATGNIDTANKYAYSENTGWRNFHPTGSGVTAVTVNTTFLSGFVWAENIGYVKLGNESGGPYNNTSSSDWGVNRDGSGNLSGYAWSENVDWINFNPSPPSRLTIGLSDGSFDGFAWFEKVGWIHFKNTSPAYNVLTTFTGGSGGGATEVISTMPEWAMIIFMILTGMTAVYYLKKRETVGRRRKTEDRGARRKAQRQ